MRSLKTNVGMMLLAGIFSSLAIPQSVLATFDTNLSLGSTGEVVLELQKFLNSNKETRVADIGPGSPGNETYYFGNLTKNAVIKFQEYYRDEILLPVGLYYGSGHFGTQSRKKAMSLYAQNSTPQKETSLDIQNQTTAPKDTSPTNIAQEEFPSNLVNLDLYINKVKEVSKKHNVDDKTIALLESQIRVNAVVYPSFSKMLWEAERKAGESVLKERQITEFKNFLSSFERRDLSFYNSEIKRVKILSGVVGKKPLAQGSGLDFGGRVSYTMLCTCTGTWQMYVGTPSNVLLDYETGTQQFLSFNAPYTSWLLGKYQPGSQQMCQIYIGTGCTTINADGYLDGYFGSSP